MQRESSPRRRLRAGRAQLFTGCCVLTQPTLFVLFLRSLHLTPIHRAFRIPNSQRANGISPIKIKFTKFETEYKYDAVYIVERENFDDVPSASAWTTAPRSQSNNDGYSTRYWGPCTSQCTTTSSNPTVVTTVPYEWEVCCGCSRGRVRGGGSKRREA